MQSGESVPLHVPPHPLLHVLPAQVVAAQAQLGMQFFAMHSPSTHCRTSSQLPQFMFPPHPSLNVPHL
jgi:hypothetical protein